MTMIAQKGATAPAKKRFGDARDSGDIKNQSTMPPKTRPGATYPGGKFLRKAQAKLSARQAGCKDMRANLGKGAKALPETCYTMPGSMKG